MAPAQHVCDEKRLTPLISARKSKASAIVSVSAGRHSVSASQRRKLPEMK